MISSQQHTSNTGADMFTIIKAKAIWPNSIYSGEEFTHDHMKYYKLVLTLSSSAFSVVHHAGVGGGC